MLMSMCLSVVMKGKDTYINQLEKQFDIENKRTRSRAKF